MAPFTTLALDPAVRLSYRAYGHLLPRDVVLNPAVIAMTPPPAGARIHAENRTQVSRLGGVNTRVPVPPGKYTVEIAGQKVPLDLDEGQVLEIKLQ